MSLTAGTLWRTRDVLRPRAWHMELRAGAGETLQVARGAARATDCPARPPALPGRLPPLAHTSVFLREWKAACERVQVP